MEQNYGLGSEALDEIGVTLTSVQSFMENFPDMQRCGVPMRPIAKDSLQEVTKALRHVADLRAMFASSRAQQQQPAVQPEAAPHGVWKLVLTPITEEMHVAAVKVLHRAHGVDGLPQRMLDALLASAPPSPPPPVNN